MEQTLEMPSVEVSKYELRKQKQCERQRNFYQAHKPEIRKKQNERNRNDPNYNKKIKDVYRAQPQKDKQKIRNRINRLVKLNVDENWKELLLPIRGELVSQAVRLHGSGDHAGSENLIANLNATLEEEMDRIKDELAERR